MTQQISHTLMRVCRLLYAAISHRLVMLKVQLVSVRLLQRHKLSYKMLKLISDR